MNQEMLIGFSELSHLSIPCTKCKTQILLDCNDRESRMPNECPGCGEEYGDSFRAALQTYREVYRKLADAHSRRVEFRIERI